MANYLNESFNDISFRLKILTNKPQQNDLIPILESDAKVLDVSAVDIWEWVDCECRFMTTPDLSEIAFNNKTIMLKNKISKKLYVAPNGVAFTFKELIDVIEDFSANTREQIRYMDGPDIYHVIFEALFKNDDGSYSINWGT